MIPLQRLFIFSLLLLTACGQAVRSNPTQSIDISSSRTGSPTKSITLAFSPTPQETTIPSTATTTPTPQKNSAPSAYTPTSYPTDFPTPTPTTVPPGWSLLFDPHLAERSPDGIWFWENEPGDLDAPKILDTTHFVSADGKTEWRIHPKPEEIGDWPKAYYYPLFWSPKEPYVFLVGRGCCADGPGSAYIDTSLVRLNLSTGFLSTLIPWGSNHSFSFSPTGKYMNRATIGEHSIHITRLLDGHEIEIVLPERYYDFGAGYWSPDGKRFVLYICELDDPGEEFCQKRPILLLDPEKDGYQVIITDTLGEGWDSKWIDATHFQFQNSANSNETKTFDAETGKFVP